MPKTKNKRKNGRKKESTIRGKPTYKEFSPIRVLCGGKGKSTLLNAYINSLDLYNLLGRILIKPLYTGVFSGIRIKSADRIKILEVLSDDLLKHIEPSPYSFCHIEIDREGIINYYYTSVSTVKIKGHNYIEGIKPQTVRGTSLYWSKHAVERIYERVGISDAPNGFMKLYTLSKAVQIYAFCEFYKIIKYQKAYMLRIFSDAECKKEDVIGYCPLALLSNTNVVIAKTFLPIGITGTPEHGFFLSHASPKLRIKLNSEYDHWLQHDDEFKEIYQKYVEEYSDEYAIFA